MLGFLTKEFAVDRGTGPEPLLAVYVPTNHLYLGDIVVCRPNGVTFPDMTVEEGMRVFLTGGMGAAGRHDARVIGRVASTRHDAWAGRLRPDARHVLEQVQKIGVLMTA